MKLLILRLEGVLQSWGERSHWDHRDTTTFPTKSGIVGLLGCAMGIPRGDERLSTLSDELELAVRADRPGSIMTDYHTVQSRGGKFLNTEGKPRGDTIVTPRGYLEDACFTVFLSGPDELLNTCADALRHPIWVPCLGRRSCPPMQPLLPVLCSDYDSIHEATRHFFWQDSPVRSTNENMICQIEDAQGNITRSDQPIDASRNRYAIRRVRYEVVRKEETPCI